MAHNSLPGFDAWLTHNPMDDNTEPSEQNYKDARAILTSDGGEASEDDILDVAYELMERDFKLAQEEEDEHILDNFLDDREEQVGREP